LRALGAAPKPDIRSAALTAKNNPRSQLRHGNFRELPALPNRYRVSRYAGS
jgi:hypothetical protein